MKVFVIEGRRGFYHKKEILAGYSFPAGFGSLKESTQFPNRPSAERAIKKNKLNVFPHSSHVEEFNWAELNE